MCIDTFNNLVDHVWEHRKYYYEYPVDYLFDYPNYGNLPREISNGLTPEAVDAMQYIWEDFAVECSIKTKSQFRSTLKRQLRELGEKITQ